MAKAGIVTAREVGENGVIGQLELPPPRPEDSDVLEIGGFPICARFGSVFEPIAGLAGAWTPVIPFFRGGQLYEEWLDRGGGKGFGEEPLGAAKEGNIVIVPARGGPEMAVVSPQKALPATVARGVLYHYERDDYKLEEDLEVMASLLPPGSLLVIPPLGTNNNISFAESAFRIFYSLLACAEQPGASFRKNLVGVVLLAPFETPPRVPFSGARTVQHFFNLFRVHRETREEPVCDVCFTLRRDALLSCGHRFCLRCIMDVQRVPPAACPLCRRPIVEYHPCYRLNNAAGFACCARGEEKEDCVFVPCGHHRALCKSCGTALRAEARPRCRVCGEAAFAYMRVYH